MRLLFLFLLISTSLSAQLNNDLKNQIKFKSYRYLDSIDVYSKKYPINLLKVLDQLEIKTIKLLVQ